MGIELKDKIEYSLKIYNDISRQIQFADTKAGLILAWQGATLFFLFKVLFSIEKLKLDSIGWLLLILALFFVGTSILRSFSTIYPRLSFKDHNSKCMFWIIDIKPNHEDFLAAKNRFMSNIKEENQLFECLSNSIIFISDILKTKYKNVQVALGGLLAGFIFEVVLLLYLLYTKPMIL